MKHLYFRCIAVLLYSFLHSSFSSAQNESNIDRSYVILNVNGNGNTYYDLNNDSPGNPNFSGSLGTFTPSNSLLLNGAQIQTYKCGLHNIMNGFVDYRVYLASNTTPPAFIPSEILYNTNNPTSNHCGGTSLDQTWESSGANINLLAGLPSGDYILEVYTRADVDYDNTDGIDTKDTTYYISDGGNNYSMSFRVDNPPVAECQPMMAVLDATGNVTITASQVDDGSSDDFGIASMTLNNDTFSCADIGNNFVVLTITDTMGQTDTCTTIVTVVDSTAPTITLTGSNPQTIEVCGTYTEFGATANDLCFGDISGDIVIDASTVNTSIVGSYSVTYNVMDAEGNVATEVIRTVNVVDTTIPTITLNGDNPQIIQSCGTYTEQNATANDPCFGDISGNIVIDVSSVDTSSVGTYTVTYNVTDAEGNASIEVVRTVNVVDTTVPSITLSGANPQIIEACAAYTELGATANDPCFGDISGDIVIDSSAINTGVVGSYSVTYNVTDADGNPAAQMTRTVNVVDSSIPSIILTGVNPQIIEACTTYTELGATANDPCFGDVSSSIVINSTTVDTSVAGTYSVTYNVTDADGNVAAQVIRTINVVDTTNPTITCPSNITASAAVGTCSSLVNYTAPVGSDSCSGVTTTQIAGLASGSNFPVGITTNTFRVTDAAGNISECSFTVTVNDNQLPTIVCPPTVTVSSNTNCEVATINLGVPTTTDNCSVASVTNNLSSLLPLPTGTFTVTWTVVDGAGNSATCNQTVIVEDTSSPTISCPGDLTIQTDSGACSASGVVLGTPTTGDNCAVTVSNNAPSMYPIGITTVTWTATDGSGNTASCAQTVTVEDHQAPTAICRPYSVALDASGNASITTANINNGSTDNCGIASMSLSQTTFDCSDVGTNTVTLTVIDNAGNSSTCDAVVTIMDPAANSTVIITSSPASPICDGTNVSFTATPSNAGNNILYQWFVDGTSMGAPSSSNQYTTNALSNGDDVYVVMTSGPCNTVRTSNTLVMTVNPSLPVSFTLNATNNPICPGESVTFFITNPQNFGSNPTYLWRINGASTGVTTPTLTRNNLTNNQVVSVQVTSNATCATPTPQTQSITMTVTPNATISNPGNRSQTRCINAAIAPINFTLDHATGATVTGLPTGITGNYAGNIFTLSGAPTQTGVFNYTVTPTGCGTATRTGTITVNPAAAINLVSGEPDQTVCRTNPSGSDPIVDPIVYNIPYATSVSVTGLPAGVTYTYTGGNVTIGGNPGNTIPPGTYTYTITATGCGTATAQGTIRVFSGPPAQPSTINGPSSFLCPINTAIYYVANDPNVETYNWTVPNTMAITNGQGTNQIEVEIVGGVTFFQNITVRASNACGLSPVRSLGVLVSYSSAPISAGPEIYVCEGTNTVTMNGNVGNIQPYEWEWSDNGAGGSFSTVGTYDPPPYCDGFLIFGICFGTPVNPPPRDLYATNSTYTLPANTQAGDVITISLISNNVWNPFCDPIISTMHVYVLESPDAEFVSPSAICQGDTLVVNGTPNTTVSYTFNGAPVGTFNIGASGTVSFPNLGIGTYALTSIQYTNSPNNSALGCVTPITGESVTINQPPTVDAGPPTAVICSGDTVNLSGATFAGTNSVANWSTSGSGSFNGSIYTPSTTDIFNGTVTLTYTNTPSDDVCNAVSDSMVITINPAATVNAGVNQAVCADGSITLAGSFGGSASSATWSAPSGSFSNVNSLTSTYTPSIISGTVILTLTTNDPAGPCGPVTDTVTITVNPAATVNAGIDQVICSGNVAIMSASIGGSANSGMWSSSGTGSFSNNTLGAIYTPSAGDMSNGSVVLTYTTNNPAGVCNAASDSLVLTINPASTVDAGANQMICSTQTTVNLNAILGGSATSGTWSTSGNGSFSSNSPNAVYTLGAGDVGTITLTYETNDPSGPCTATSDAMQISIQPYVAPVAANLTTIGNCNDTTIQLSGNGTGTWSAVSIPAGSAFNFSNMNSGTSTFTGVSGVTYDITWTIDNPSACADDSDTIQVEFPNCGNFIDFDGSNDYVNNNNHFNFNGGFTIEVWIKRDDNANNIQTILSKRDANDLSTGYDLRLNNGRIQFRWNSAGSIQSPQPLNNLRWYHVAVTYGSGTYRLFIDGIPVVSTNGVLPTSNTYDHLIGAVGRINNTPLQYFHGSLDELRIWNTPLDVTEIREMMNQQIDNNGGSVHGSELDMDIAGLDWSDLEGYYRMNQGNDINAGQLADNSASNFVGSLRNMTSLQDETAPLPYISTQNGNWGTAGSWVNGNVQLAPNGVGVDGTTIDWNIVRTGHNITITNLNVTLLGLIVDSAKLAIRNSDVTDGQSLTITNYLKIDGNLDLVGESQLLMGDNSLVDPTGIGVLERDQQGTTNLFNYNYWGSPVSSATNSFSLATVLRDGTNVNNPMPLQWTSANNSSATSPLTLSRRWLYTYENYIQESYADWNPINENSLIAVGLGYTMKGSSAGGSLQNYTFAGTPNNGTITSPITNGNQALIGNPYPSAIDGHEFIRDNMIGGNPGSTQSIDGTLYFWEQSPTNNSHTLAEYLGGYATLNLSGGLAAVAPSEIAGEGASNKIPKRFVPVGQGFYVTGTNTGLVQFKNTQRFFVKESSGNSDFLRVASPDTEDNMKRIRLKFKTPQGGIRPLMMAFTDDNVATDGFDYGYDAENTDGLSNDMSFMIGTKKYVIEGVGRFDDTKQYPLGIFLSNTGTVEISLTAIENFEASLEVFIYDSLMNSYHPINDTSYMIQLEAGDYINRFFLSFREDDTLSIIDNDLQTIIVNYLQSTDEIYIKTPSVIQVKQVYLINIIGQTVRSWNSTNIPLSSEMRIPVKDISEGNYIIKIQTNTGSLNKKIIIHY